MSKFFSKLKGEKETRSDLTSEQGQSSFSSNNPYRSTQSQPPAYEPPPGPPPSHKNQHQELPQTNDTDNPPPYHDWTSIPDNALLPPPPPITSDYSSATNASYDAAAAAHAWCARNPVWTPKVPHVSVMEGVMSGRNGLNYPPGFRGVLKNLTASPQYTSMPNAFGAAPTTVFQILSASNSTTSNNAASTSQHSNTHRFLKSTTSSSNQTNTRNAAPVDQLWTSSLPLYFAATSNPLSPHFANPKPTPFTIYFEITPLRFYTADSTVSIGYAGLPYPPARQPGWHRASIGVHSDDGNRYVNDSWGGTPFTQPFRPGETIGLALVFEPQEVLVGKEGRATLQSEREVRSGLRRVKTRVYLTRNGSVVGSWDGDEERDAERDEGVAGLLGEVDLYAAVGTFGGVDVLVRFYRQGEGFVAPPTGM